MVMVAGGGEKRWSGGGEKTETGIARERAAVRNFPCQTLKISKVFLVVMWS
jgi:hypothetical protein